MAAEMVTVMGMTTLALNIASSYHNKRDSTVHAPKPYRTPV